MTAIQAFHENSRVRVLHHHTFDAPLVRRMHEYVGFQTILSFVAPNDKLQLVYLGSKPTEFAAKVARAQH